MQRPTATRPYALTIAGFDPSGGAGIVADAKTMESLGVYGLSVATCITVQHESALERVDWLPLELIQAQAQLLLEHYAIGFLKIGLFPSWDQLEALLRFLRKLQPELYVVVDPIFRATAGYDFHQNQQPSAALLSSIDLLTPNEEELRRLALKAETPHQTAQRIATQHTAVLYKGGHNAEQRGVDFLYEKGQSQPISFAPNLAVAYDKHGSGCVLSAALTAQLALGEALPQACEKAKAYTARFLNSSPTLLGYHYP